MKSSQPDNPLLNALAEAESANDPVAVVRALHQLLKDNFEMSAKLAFTKRKKRKYLERGILCDSYLDTFWQSDTPAHFVENFGTHPVWRFEFWESCLGQKRLPFHVIDAALLKCPALLEEGIRRNRYFLDDEKWEQIEPRLSASGLNKFVAACGRIRAAVAAMEQRLRGFDALLGKVAPETIVIQFSAWLEHCYFNRQDGARIDESVADYFEVLEHALRLNHQHRAKDDSPKEPHEIDAIMKQLTEKVVRKTEFRPDCFGLFETLEAKLNFDLELELFAQHLGEVVTENELLRVALPDKDQKQAWDITGMKFCAFDTFVTYVPRSEDEQKRKDEISRNSPNDESAEALWNCEAGLKLLFDYLGKDGLAAFEEQLGVGTEKVLLALNCYRSCMQIQFNQPRKDFKRSGFIHATSWLMPTGSARQDSAIFSCIRRSLVRLPAETRTPNQMAELAMSFFKGRMEIEKAEAEAIFDLFAADIHQRGLKLQDKLLVRSGGTYLLLPRLWSGDVKTFLLNAALSIKKINNMAAANFEKKVGKLFQAAGFKTLTSYELKSNGRAQREIDVAAFKDGCLFIIEAKMTYMRGRPSQVAQVGKALEGGAWQLRDVLNLLDDHWQDLALNLGIDSPRDQIKVIPLLVSNSFEYDHLYFDGILKVTDFELEMVLQNNPGITSQLAISLSQRQQDEEAQVEFMEQLQKRIGSMSEGDIEASLEDYALLPLGRPPEASEVVDALEQSRFWAKIFGKDLGLTPLLPET